jgi:hypothetical protein
MPYYIEEIGPGSAWHEDNDWLKGCEVEIVRLVPTEPGEMLAGAFHIVDSTHSNFTHSCEIKLRYEDYPSQEVRDGTIKPKGAEPSHDAESTHYDLSA